MGFSDKLNYLFELVHAEGKELAKTMNITPPQISKMRNGKRGLPRNHEDALVMADFFAKRCNSNFLIDSLFTVMRIPKTSYINNEIELSQIILNWLSDNEFQADYGVKKADSFLRQFSNLSKDRCCLSDSTDYDINDEQSHFFVHYGNEGKRLTLNLFCNYLLSLDGNFRIDIISDEDLNWIVEDPEFAMSIKIYMHQLTEKACYFRHISGQICDMDQAFDSLNRWFPLYLTGKATSYYYKRLRDNLNRLTLFVVKDLAVMFSFSVGNKYNKDSATFFTTDQKIVNSMQTEFENYLSFCEPLSKLLTESTPFEEFSNTILDYESSPYNSIQYGNSLSLVSLPEDIVSSLNTKYNSDKKNSILSFLVKRKNIFMTILQNHTFIDIICLSNIQDIINGKVPIPMSSMLGMETLFYSKADYLKHLKAILLLLEQNKNYHIIIHNNPEFNDTIISVKENYCSVIIRNTHPFSLFKVSERYLADAFTEFLRRMLPEDLNDNKRKAIAAIKDLINSIIDYKTL